MVARRKKLKEQLAAGDGNGRLDRDRKLKVDRRKDKAKQKKALEAEKLAKAKTLELEAIEERKLAKKKKKEEKRKRKEAEKENASNGEDDRRAGEAKHKKDEEKKRKRKGAEKENATSAEEDRSGGELQEAKSEDRPKLTKKENKDPKNKKKKKVDRWGEAVTAAEEEFSQPAKEEDGNDDAHQSEEAVEFEPKRIYAGGMPYTTTEDDIHNYFSECGAIEEIDYTTFPDTGRFRGLAFITFKTENGAKNALKLDGADMGGRFLRIMKCKKVMQDETKQQKATYSEPPSKTEGCTSVYIGNLSWDISEKELQFFFKKCKIARIRLAHDKETREFKGYGHVDFEDDESVEKAVKLDQKLLLGRPIKIAYAVPPKKASNEQQQRREPRKKNGCFNCGEEGHMSFHSNKLLRCCDFVRRSPCFVFFGLSTV